MPEYTIELSRHAEKQLNKLNDFIADPILKAIGNLAKNPRPVGYLKLKGKRGYRVRVGNYRILYDIFDKVLTINVIAIGDRKDVYQ